MTQTELLSMIKHLEGRIAALESRAAKTDDHEYASVIDDPRIPAFPKGQRRWWPEWANPYMVGY
jgi:hypothetical protein